MTVKIEGVEFANNEYTRVRFKRVNAERGTIHLAELTVPENHERGVNKDWDTILDNYDLETLKQKRIDKIEQTKKRLAVERVRAESRGEAEELKELFNEKSYHIKMPYTQSSDDKKLIRRAPNLTCLNYVVFELIKKYVESNDSPLEDMFDKVEDAIYDQREE